MRHIFIDLGCYNGDTIQEFLHWKELAYPVVGWDIYGFDGSPNHKKAWSRMPDFHFEHSAAWVRDGEIEFSNNHGDTDMGSTVIKEKDHWKLGDIIKVPCFDFSQWLEQFRGSKVVLKMDIEGAEMPVLTKMIKDGTDNIADITFIEFHDHKYAYVPDENNYSKTDILSKYRGKVVLWH